MVKLIPPDRLAPRWQVLQLDSDNSCNLLVARLTAEQCVTGLASPPDESTGAYQMRLARLLILDWSDVTEEIATEAGVRVVPVAYSFDALCRLISQFPQSIWKLLDIVTTATIGLSETDQKNWPTPPANGGTTTPADALTSSGSSDYGTIVEDEKRSEPATI